MRRLRWLLLALYVTLVLLLVGNVAWDLFGQPDLLILIALVVFSVAAQLFFIFIPGRPEYLTPIGPRRLILPVVIAGLMMAILAFGFCMALADLIWGSGPAPLERAWPFFCLGVWVFWAVLFYVQGLSRNRHTTMRRMVAWLVGGSLLELLVSVPSHLIVVRRPGCMVGMASWLGIMAGIYVMVWAFGPGIALMFWWETRKRMAGHCPACGYNLHGLSEQRCPECGRRFTFAEVRTTPEELGFIGRQGG